MLVYISKTVNNSITTLYLHVFLFWSVNTSWKAVCTFYMILIRGMFLSYSQSSKRNEWRKECVYWWFGCVVCMMLPTASLFTSIQFTLLFPFITKIISKRTHSIVIIISTRHTQWCHAHKCLELIVERSSSICSYNYKSHNWNAAIFVPPYIPTIFYRFFSYKRGLGYYLSTRHKIRESKGEERELKERKGND